MNTQKIAAIVLIVGSILFLIGAFSPISMAFFSEREEAKRLEIAMDERRAWTVSQIFFALGAVVTAVGVGLASYHFRALAGGGLAFLAAAVVVIGAGYWFWHVYLRTVDPTALVEGTLPAWYFSAYTLLTQAGLVAFGILLIRAPIPGWVGWVVISGVFLSFATYLVLKDMPPFAYYLLTLLAGIMMYRAESAF